MPNNNVFHPPRQRGLLIHGGGGILLIAVSGASFWYATQQQVGVSFVFLLLLSLILLVPLGLALYRGYALIRASYELERDGLRLTWGLRVEEIPLNDVEWIRPANEMGFNLPLPFLPIPGALLGSRSMENLGVVEFMASDIDTLLLVATSKRIFAISPAEPNKFLRAFQRSVEMGSLSPISSHSTLPAAFLQQVWSDRLARLILIMAVSLSILLFAVIGMSIPGRSSISLGFTADGRPHDAVPAEQLLLLPVLNMLTLVGDLVVGLYFYHRDDEKRVSYLLWIGAVITPLILFVAFLFIR